SLARGSGGYLCKIRCRSPLGGSTLMTSAPKSDRITAAAGHAMKLARSTTFNPEKILSVAIYTSVDFAVRYATLPASCFLLPASCFLLPLTAHETPACAFPGKPTYLHSCLPSQRTGRNRRLPARSLRSGPCPSLC